jgi:hypothetical protein
MLRIVEIENRSAKSQFDEGVVGGGNEHYDCTATKPKPVAAEPEPAKAEPSTGNDGRGRRISFQDNNARPSSIGSGTAGVASNNKIGTSSPARKRSPPPISAGNRDYLDPEDDDDTSSDDYDEPETYQYGNAKKARTAPKVTSRPVRDAAYSDEEEDVYDDDDDFGDDMGGGLTRFESASAKPPRMVRSTSSSSSEDEDVDEPVTPPQLPADLDLHELLAGEKDGELENLFESVRRCSCHGHSEDPDTGKKAEGMWDVPIEKSPEGKRLAVVAVAA